MSWTKRRRAFNHDWLKSHYLIALGRWINVLDDLVEDADFARDYLSGTFRQWEDRAPEALALARDFAEEASPRRRLDRPPLSSCDDATRAWLGDLTHGLWLARAGVEAWSSRIAGRVADVDRAYRAIRDGDVTRPSREPFVEFQRRCRRLARELEVVPPAEWS